MSISLRHDNQSSSILSRGPQPSLAPSPSHTSRENADTKWDFWQAATSRQGLTDSAGHAGGIAFGVLAALYARQKYLGNWRRGFRM